MLILHRLGKNTTVIATMNGRVYKYEYKRSKSEGSTHTTFSDDLESLELLYKEELKIENYSKQTEN
jgi:hypothetical protein